MKRMMITPSLQANPTRKSPRKQLRDIVDTVEKLDIKQLIVPIRKVIIIRAQKENLSTKKKQSTKGDQKGKGHKNIYKNKYFNVGNMDIMHVTVTVQNHMITLILLKKVSKTRKSRICWIWTIVV